MHGKNVVIIQSHDTFSRVFARLNPQQFKVNDKSNEITAIPESLEMLEIEGSIVTIDLERVENGIVIERFSNSGQNSCSERLICTSRE